MERQAIITVVQRSVAAARGTTIREIQESPLGEESATEAKRIAAVAVEEAKAAAEPELSS